MTTIYSSNFDSDTAGNLPAGWASKVGTWSVTTNGAVSGANALASSTNADGDVALYTAASALADMRISTSQKTVANGVRYPIIGHVLRADSANANNYTVVFSTTTTSGFNVLFFKKVGGTYSQLGSAVAVNLARVVGDTLNITCEIIGNTINVYAGVNTAPGATPVATKTDASITAAGYAGVYNSKDTATIAMSIDNFVLDNTVTISAATATTLTGPTSGVVGTASAAFTVGADGPITGTVTVTPSDGGAGGTFSPTSVAISSASPTATFTYTASSAGAKTISVTNNGGLSNPSSIDYTAASAASTVSSVTVSPSTATVSGGGTQQFTATVAGTNSPSQAVTWAVTSGVGTINSSGLYTAPAATGSAQSATITATSAQDGTKAGTATVTVPVAAANNALTSGTGNVLFSPYNWDIQASAAKTINAGAYFKTIFGGTTCTLNFDMTGIASPIPQISYRVDRFGPWITVPIAASVAITIPSDTADYASKGGHLLEVLVKSMTETQARWSTQATAVRLTGIILDVGKTISAPTALPLKAIFYGDSITEGVRTVNMTATNDTDRNDAGQGWSLEVARILGAEIGNVGFGATGFNKTGSGSVPAFTGTYNYLYSGVARSFSPSPDLIVWMMGTNDSTDVTTSATTVLNGLLAATTAKIIVLRPFKDATHATQLQNAIAACTTPSRVTYVDTNGWFNTANSSDALHPYGNENITHIAPLAAAAIRTALTAPAATTARTVTITLTDAAGSPRTNLSGLKWAFFDQARPDIFAAPTSQGAVETTDGSGQLVINVNTSLASGGIGWLDITDSDGTTTQSPAAKAFSGPVVVA
jgi:hypothetical protein